MVSKTIITFLTNLYYIIIVQIVNFHKKIRVNLNKLTLIGNKSDLLNFIYSRLKVLLLVRLEILADVLTEIPSPEALIPNPIVGAMLLWAYLK